jgi:signal transduction histidine kinase
VQRVFVNLIGNALKYSRGRPAREVEVGGQRDTVESTYWVRDNGPGFEPSRAPEIFEPFKRLQGAKVEGAGLGLAIVAKLVRRQGGRVWAESDGMAGASFYFTLPAQKREGDDQAGDPAGR